jgi:hypothetical protein
VRFEHFLRDVVFRPERRAGLVEVGRFGKCCNDIRLKHVVVSLKNSKANKKEGAGFGTLTKESGYRRKEKSEHKQTGCLARVLFTFVPLCSGLGGFPPAPDCIPPNSSFLFACLDHTAALYVCQMKNAATFHLQSSARLV